MSFESRSINHNEKSVMAGIEHCNNFHDLIVWIYPYVEQDQELLKNFALSFPGKKMGETFTERIIIKAVERMLKIDVLDTNATAISELNRIIEGLTIFDSIRNN